MTYSQAPLTHRAASLETAACLWEAVLTMLDTDEYTSGDAERRAVGDQVRAARDFLGTSHLRLTVIGWTDIVDAAWLEADGCEDMGRGGEYGGSFDWDFVPGWIDANIDWSDPHNPTYRPSVHAASNAPELSQGNISRGFTCSACGRVEDVCSAEPCAAVIADREA